MIVGMHPQHFLRNQLQRKQQFRAVRQQHIDICSLELHNQIGILKIRMGIVARLKVEFQFETRIGNHLPKKLLDPWTCLVNRIACAQVRFLVSFAEVAEITFFCGAITVTGEAVLLKNHCWVI